MSISTPFIQRPVATTLLLVALTLAGGIAYTLLPVSALPEVDFPTINVQRQPAGRESRGDGGVGRHAAREAVHAHRRRHGDDVEQLGRIGAGHAAVRSEPRHQRRGARSAGGHQLRRPDLCPRIFRRFPDTGRSIRPTSRFC